MFGIILNRAQEGIKLPKLYMRQDGGLYTKINMGGIVTMQIHPDAIDFLDRHGVQIGQEIPAHVMKTLRNKRGWLYTKGEFPFAGPIDPSFQMFSSGSRGTTKGSTDPSSVDAKLLTPEEREADAWYKLQVQRAREEDAKLERIEAEFKRKYGDPLANWEAFNTYVLEHKSESGSAIMTMVEHDKSGVDSPSIGEYVGRFLGRAFYHVHHARRHWRSALIILISIVVIVIFGALVI